jgi:hypothetical protein
MQEINNPDMNLEIWKQLKTRWVHLSANGHHVAVDFNLITAPEDKHKVLSIDVIQHIDAENITDTVQRSAGEAYALLGLKGLSKDRLEQLYKNEIRELHRQSGGNSNSTLTVTMSPSSPTSGELKAVLEFPNSDTKTSVTVNYIHYYILNALREKMMETVGEGWKKVSAVHQSDSLEFYFDY